MKSSLSSVDISNERLPLPALLTLAMGAFITILTEALPAGLLPQMAQSLNVSESWVGQTITVYALGSLLTAIPLTTMTQSIRRRPLLLSALLGFAVANLITTLSSNFVLTMMARFLAGVSAGLLWALLAGYAARISPEHLKGRAIAIAMLGTPLALSLGVPLGTYLGNMIGWRMTFAVMSIIALLLLFWGRFILPDFSGQKSIQKFSIKQVITLSGIGSILLSVLGFVLAHNILYTYIIPFLTLAAIEQHTDLILLTFGMSSLLGIWIIGVLIDRYLRVLTLLSIVLFGFAAFLLAVMNQHTIVVFIAVTIWGIAFGGAATLFQTALAETAGDSADVAQSMLVTVWNTAIAAGGVLGGVLLDRFGAISFAPTMLLLLLIVFVVVWRAKNHGFAY